MPKGQKAKVVENSSMNSRMTEENFDRLMLHNIVSEIRDGKKVLLKCDFYVKNFYIQGKKGTMNIWKIMNEPDTFRFRWTQSNLPPYIDRCCSINADEYCYDFKSFAEFDEKLKKIFICKYHVSCREERIWTTTNCSADFLISPEEQCAICLNDIQQHLLEETACGHKFCLSCLNTYVESKGGQRKIPCPTCRRNLTYCSSCGNAKYNCEGFVDCHDGEDDDDDAE